MIDLDALKQHYLNQAKQSADSTQPWLNHLRRQGYAALNTLGFPQRHHEAWKYTRINEFAQQKFSLSASANTNVAIDSYLLPELNCHTLIFIDGEFHKSSNELPQHITNLANISDPIPQLEESITTLSEFPHGFAALNAALAHDGAVIHIPANAIIEQPIHCVFVNTQPQLSNYHNTIIADANSQATIIETYVGTNDESTFTNTTTTLHLSNNAKLKHIKLQHESPNTFHVGTINTQQASHSQFHAFSLAMGGKWVRSDTNTFLNQTNASCELNGLFLANARQHIDHHTSIEHVAAHTNSREHYRGILGDHARGVFNGRVHVHPDAQRIDSSQQNKNLLLSDTAQVNTKPELEIYADDVKCAHGATVGQLDEQAIYYLRSRGVDRQQARSLLTYAFANTLIDGVSLPVLKDTIAEQMWHWLDECKTPDLSSRSPKSKLSRGITELEA